LVHWLIALKPSVKNKTEISIGYNFLINKFGL
jgi:hypothetical protein